MLNPEGGLPDHSAHRVTEHPPHSPPFLLTLICYHAPFVANREIDIFLSMLLTPAKLEQGLLLGQGVFPWVQTRFFVFDPFQALFRLLLHICK